MAPDPEPSTLRLLSIEDLRNDRIAITWSSLPGADYAIQSSVSLRTWEEFESMQGALDATTTRFEVERTDVANTFYRILSK